DYSLHRDYLDFLGWPQFGGQPTYLVGMVHILALVVGAWILLRAGKLFWSTRQLARAEGTQTGFTLAAAFGGYGPLLPLSCVAIHRHYMLIVYPFELLWLARLALGRSEAGGSHRRTGRRLLTGLCLCQALLAVAFLGYIHTHQYIDGDYGTPYRVQHHSQAVAFRK